MMKDSEIMVLSTQPNKKEIGDITLKKLVKLNKILK